MEFNIQKFLVENKLTRNSYLREDDNTELTLHTQNDETPDNEDDFEDEEPQDDWNKPEADDSEEWDTDYTGDTTQPEPALSGIRKKQAQLQALEAQKDSLLMQFKSGQISIDQYKEAIGNIPDQIKKLRADVQKAMTVSTDDDNEEEYDNMA